MLKLLLLCSLVTATDTERMVGGFEKKPDTSDCVERLKQILPDYPIFGAYKVTSCETQLVNGMNYRLTLVNVDKKVKKCQIMIHESINKEISPLKYRQQEKDCFTMFENQKVNTSEK